MGNTILGANSPTGYDVTNSCLFDGSNDNFNITHSGSATGARRTMTFSCWVKLGILGSVSSTHCNFLNGYVNDDNYSGFGIAIQAYQQRSIFVLKWLDSKLKTLNKKYKIKKVSHQINNV